MKKLLDSKVFVFSIFILLAVIYIYFRSPFIGFSDELQFTATGLTGFNFGTSATNHFLYVNSLVLLKDLFSFIDPIGLYVAFSMICSIFTLFVLFQLVYHFSGSKLAGLFAVIILGLSYTYWRQSEIIEVYSMDNFFFFSYISLAIVDLKRKALQMNRWVSLIFGLSLFVHIQNILSLPFMFYYWYQVYQQKGSKVIQGPVIALVFFIGLLIIPSLGNLHPVKEVFVSNFEDAVFAFSVNFIVMGFIKSIAFLLYNFHLFLIIIGVGMVQLLKHDKRLLIQLLLLALPGYVFAMRYQVNDSHVFYLHSYIVLAIFGGLGFHQTIKKYNAFNLSFLLLGASVILPLVFYYLVTVTACKTDLLSEFDKNNKWKGGIPYYTFPGMRDAKDPLEYAHRWYLSGNKDSVDLLNWNYNYKNAVIILKETGKIPKN